MSDANLTLAMIHDVFCGSDAAERLEQALQAARRAGATLAVLPELPLNAWVPATRRANDDDAEPPDGPRQRIQSAAARRVGLGLVGGAIVRDPASGRRFNTALVYGADGALRGRYRKLHLPEEEGFWETSHYEPGDELPSVVDGFALRLGLQICSDVNRPAGSQVLAALGADVILAPRCTPRTSYERWKLVLRGNAVTSSTFVISTNRPRPERGVPIGGASIAIGPDGDVLSEIEEALGVVTLDGTVLRRSRVDYPGYLPVRASLYARSWRQIDHDD